MTLDDLGKRLANDGLFQAALASAAPAIEVAAVSGIREGMNAGISPDGTPYAPLTMRAGGRPLRDKGLLAASTSASVTGDQIALRANAPGARLHQFGGVVVPVNAKSLAIPVSPEARRAGSPRNFPRPLFRLGGKDSGRGGVLAERTGKGKAAKVVVHYLLRKSVTIPARKYLGISAKTSGRIGAILSRSYAATVRQSLGN